MKSIDENTEIVTLFEAQLTRSEDAFSRMKRHWKEDNDFSMGEQWDGESRKGRSSPGKERPCITVNKIDPLVHRIVNDAMQQEMEAEVKPIDSDSSPHTAYILEGLVRKIQVDSKAKEKYIWAYQGAVRAGFGYFRILPDYLPPPSFDQTLRVEFIKDPMSVSYDPDCLDSAGKDANFAIISEEISMVAAMEIIEAVGADASDLDFIPDKKIWEISSGTVRHAEMYWKVRKDDTLFLLKDNSTVYKSELDAEKLAFINSVPGMILKQRDVRSFVVRYTRLCNGKVIEKFDTSSKYIPIVRVVGREGYIDGEKDFRGITRNSMDSNRMYNVMSSLLLERIGLAPRAPYIGAAGQFEGYEDQWLNANNENLPKLEYNPVALAGVPLPPPSKNDAASGDPTIERYMQITEKDIKDTSAMSDAFMGTRTNETSGAGIKARAAQSGTATYDFLEQLKYSIEHAALIMIDMIPSTFSEQEVIGIIGPDYKEDIINLKGFLTPQGEVVPIDFTKGQYGIKIDVSTGDKTRREQAVESLSFLLQTNPQAGSLVMDVFVSNLDIKNADKIAKRFKAMLPPQVLAAEEEGDAYNPEAEAIKKHAQQTIDQLQQQFQQCQQALKDAEEKLKQKDGEVAVKQGELELKNKELDLKEVEVFAKIDSEKKKLELEEEKLHAETGASVNSKKFVDEEGNEQDFSDSAQLEMLIKKGYHTERELDELHQQMDAVHQILVQVLGPGQEVPNYPTENAQAEPAQQPEAMTTGNSPPPVEAETNIGTPNA